MYLPVEAACPQQCTVEYVGPVGRCKNDDTHVCAEAVHFRKELVQAQLEEYGFALAESHQIVPQRYMLVFDRRD